MNKSNSQKPNYRWRFIALALLLVAIALIYKSGLRSYLSFEYFKQNIDTARLMVATHYLLSAVTFIGILALAAALSIPLGVIMPIVGGVLFGLVPGALFSMAGAVFGGTVAFLTSRYLIGHFFQERFGSRLETFNKELQEYGYLYLLGLHFFPITPFFVLNILAGLTTLPLTTFLWTSVIGVSPAFFIYSYIGTQLTDIQKLSDLLSAKILVAFVILKALSLTTLLVGRFGKKIFNR